MNFIDVTEELVNADKELNKIDDIIFKLKECQSMHCRWYDILIVLLLNNPIEGNTTPAVGNARTLKTSTIQHYKNLKHDLMCIDFMNYWVLLSDLPKIHDQLNVLERSQLIFTDSYKTIHDFRSQSDDSNIDIQYGALMSAINSIIIEYEYLKRLIENIKNINEKLNLGTGESNFKIRLLTENNTLDSTLISLDAIESMYSVVCSIINVPIDEEQLTYKRIESGSLLLYLAGNTIALGIVGEIIAFSYKVYKEQFSWKAKQEKALGDIKVRGDYLKLIKEYKDQGIEITINPEELKAKLANLEQANIQLFKNNPHVLLNGENIGIPELQNQKMSDQFFLESAMDRIENKE